MTGYDRWKTGEAVDPFEGDSKAGHHYTCLDCTWAGRGGMAAADHHRCATPHHRVALRATGLRQEFACCAEHQPEPGERPAAPGGVMNLRGELCGYCLRPDDECVCRRD
jgi:hypothetical protein